MPDQQIRVDAFIDPATERSRRREPSQILLGLATATAIAGTILISGLAKHGYATAMITLAGIGIVGLVTARSLPRGRIGGASG